MRPLWVPGAFLLLIGVAKAPPCTILPQPCHNEPGLFYCISDSDPEQCSAKKYKAGAKCPRCGAPPPPAPGGWQHLCPAATASFTRYEGFCIGNFSQDCAPGSSKTCSTCAPGNSRCECAAPLSSGSCNTTMAACFAAASAKCLAAPGCKSFTLSPCDRPVTGNVKLSWQIFAGGSGDKVARVSSSLYAKPSPPPPPLPIPPMMDQPTPPWKPRSPCVSSTDCALNGACTAGVCKCGSGWVGPACETLDVLPAPTVGAYGYSPNRSSWGSHVIKYKGKYHGFFAEWWGNCGVNSWTQSSHVVHATADTAAGPFQFEDVSLGCESTNPHAMYDPKADTFTIFHLGDATGGGCSGGGPYNSNGACTGIDGHYGDDANETFPKGQKEKKHFVHQSFGPTGPWTAVEGGMACNNPSPMLLKNGSTYYLPP
eukprot:COSAG05_NODE_1208_length_5523_cov_14.095686_8_plen_426_part_00